MDERGLTADEVAERVARGATNAVAATTSRTLGEIVRANVLTRFNAILGVLGAIVLATGEWRDALFLGVVVVNAVIGVAQELRAKRTLDRLAILNAPVAHVVRDGAVLDVAVGAVVLDDLLELRAGDQVPADAEIVAADGLEIDESLLTGESEPIAKSPGDPALSGSIVIAGSGRARATAVGAASMAQRLAAEARVFARTRSELVDGTNRLLRYLTWALVVVGPLLLFGQLRTGDGLDAALTSTVAGLVGMVPEGLVLLTSLSFLLAALALARRHVLVQELPAVEGLARVDVVCLDKTGTLTDGEIAFAELVPLDGTDGARSREALGALAAGPAPNATSAALAAALPEPDGWTATARVPFSSARKWSAATFADRGTWVLGAPELVLPDAPTGPARVEAGRRADGGRRVLVLARAEAAAGEDGTLPDGLEPVALVELAEQLRPDAAETLRYFAAQGVTLRVLSGDSPRTVGAVARAVGLEHAEEPLDARTLPEDLDAAADLIEAHGVLGRVTPDGKRHLVRALQARGHVVAMTGDGVNDALALKDADIGVAMGSGAPATRAVAQLVLLDGRFAQLPRVVAEGRRVIANIERVASLFVIKNIYAGALAVLTSLLGMTYPYLPRHLTVISTLTIGIPAFLLALAPNDQRYVPGFLPRVLARSLPAGVLTAAAVVVAFAIDRGAGATLGEARTTATTTTVVIGLAVILELSRPLAAWKAGMVAALAALALGGLSLPVTREFFALEPTARGLVTAAACGAVAALAIVVVGRLAVRRGLLPAR